MALEPGTRFGTFEVVEPIGSGGMGEVYRATDATLKRDVALKVLPAVFVEDADRLARFQREAEILASLNHPNIAQVYGLEKADGQTAIVMELVEGSTLADRIAEGPIPVDEALGLALQVIAALEAAHDRAIIHRDLKPANVKVKVDGTVKVLDFGISKPIDTSTISGGAPVATTPALTETGVILGTAAYMSPEQARGRFVDQRTDIWAFGCLLFEMLTGQPAFGGEDVMAILARVIDRDTDLSSMPATISPAVRHTIKLCLEKDPRKRIHHVGDVRLALEGTFEPEMPTGAAAKVRPFLKRPLPLGAGMLVLGAALAGLVALGLRPEPAPRPVNRFVHQLPEGIPLRMRAASTLAVAPNGRYFAVNTDKGLYLRPMDSLEGRLIPGTEEILDTPFFSPDGRSIGYRATDTGQLKRIGVNGGAAVVIADDIDSSFLFGASWASDGTILLADDRGIFRVPESDGTPELLFASAEGERFGGPELLPDGDTVLYSVSETADWDRARIVARSIATDERRVLVEGGSSARYVETGHLVYALGTDLFARSFDVDTLSVSGNVEPLVQGVSRAFQGFSGLANYGVTDDGTLMYLAGSIVETGVTISPVWVDNDGREQVLGLEPCPCAEPRVSPDGGRIAFTRWQLDADAGDPDIWIWSIAPRTFTRLTLEPGFQRSAVWSPDGGRIAYGGPGGIHVRRADGTGAVETLLGSEAYPYSWSTDGEIVYAFREENTESYDVGVLSADGDPAPRTLLATAFDERHMALSPDGRWLAYESDESGQNEIYVRPYPDVDARRSIISSSGGGEPRWSADGRTLYFVGPDAMMASAIDAGPPFSFSTPEPQLAGRTYFRLDTMASNYAVPVEGEGLLMLKDVAGGADSAGATIVIVENWVEELKRRVPTE